jgi:carboxylesterase type B
MQGHAHAPPRLAGRLRVVGLSPRLKPCALKKGRSLQATSFFRITSDLRMRNRSIEQATRKAAQAAPVYMYVTEWKTPIDGGKWRSPHVVDLPLIFDNVSLAPSMLGYEYVYGYGARVMAARMADAWIAFARTGNPGTNALPTGRVMTKPAGPPCASTTNAASSTTRTANCARSSLETKKRDAEPASRLR